MKPRTVTTVAFNIALNPHPAGQYYKLFRTLLDLKRPFSIGGDKEAQLAALDHQTERTIGAPPVEILYGEIATFTHIDKKGAWHNKETVKEASDGEMESVLVPDHLGPNRRRFFYKFYIDKHHLIVQTKSSRGTFGPKAVQQFLETAFASKEIVKLFGDVAVTQMPDRSVVSRILGSQIISLDIKISVPNPDDNAAAENEIRKRMQERRIKSERIIVVAQSGSTVKVDSALAAAARVAETNGVVEATIKEGKRRKSISTKVAPLIVSGDYLPSQKQSEFDGFDSASRKMFGIISDQSKKST